jgi:hypothetical protein
MLRNFWVTPCSRRRYQIRDVKSALGKVFSVILLGFTLLLVCACVLIFFNLVFWFCLSVCVYSGFLFVGMCDCFYKRMMFLFFLF